MGSVRHIGSRWYARFTDAHGLRVERRLPAETKAEAKIQVAQLEKLALEARLGLSDGLSDITFSELYSKWKPIAKKRGNWRSLESRFRVHILPTFGQRKLKSIRPSDIEAFLARKSEKLAPRTCEHLRMHMQVLFNFAIRKARCFKGDNPAALAEKPRLARKLPRYLSFEHVQLVINATPKAWQSLVALAAYTGLRLGELRALELQNVDALNRVLRVMRTGESDTTKTAVERLVPVPVSAGPYLDSAVREARGKRHLFTDGRGEQLSRHFKGSDLVRNAIAHAGLSDFYKDFTFHDLRKTFGTHIYELSGDMKAAARLMGNSQEVAGLHYVGKNAKRLGELADRLDFKKLSPPGPTTALEKT